MRMQEYYRNQKQKLAEYQKIKMEKEMIKMREENAMKAQDDFKR